jgi:hypothetical protein
VDKKTGKKNEAVLGPFTIRDLTVFGSTLLLFIASLIPMFAFAYNLWNLGSLFFLGLGIVLPLIVTALFVARRLSPSTKIRIGSLSIDQFASVVASFTLAFFFLAAAGAFVPSMLIALLGALGLFAATVLGRWIPFFAGDFLGREETPAHIVAREAVAPVRKPRAPKAPKATKQPKDSKLTKDAAGAGAAGAGASLAAASGPVASGPAATGEAASGTAAGWAKRPATGGQAATPAATTPAGTSAGASSAGAASAAAPSAAAPGAPETQISGVVPAAGAAAPASTGSSTASTQAPAPGSAPSAADKTRTAGVPAAAAGAAAAGAAAAAAQTAPAAEQTQAAGVPAATGGSAPTTVNPQVRPQEPIGATVDPASRPAGDDVHPAHEAFWFAVAQPRTAVDVRTGAPAFVIEPGGWVLALEDRGNEFLVQHTDGRLGVLRDLSNIERG